jgi:hypothetical protein
VNKDYQSGLIHESVSIVIAVVERHDDFVELVEEYDAAISTCVSNYEFIIVVDGEFPEVAQGLRESELLRDRPIRIVQFTRTFGYSIAISVGIDKSKGALVFTLSRRTRTALLSLAKPSPFASGRSGDKKTTAGGPIANIREHCGYG